MRGQKGQAIILVLILLAVGSLLIVPLLRYTYTGLRSQRISEDALKALYTGDNAFEDALWQLLNNYMGTFTPGSPQVAYDFSYAGKVYHMTIQIPSVPPSQDLALGSMKHVLLQAEPNWIESTTNGTNYVLRIQTQPWTATTGIYQYTLPAGFTYAGNSAYYYGPSPQNQLAYDAEVNHTTHQVKLISGSWVAMSPGDGANYLEVYQDPPPGGYLPNRSYLVITTLGDGRQHLKFVPYYTSTGGNRTMIQTVHVNGNAWGVNYVTTGSFNIGSDTVTFDKSAAVGVAMYTVIMNIGGIAYRVTVAYDAATDTFKIVSYQAVG